MSINPIKFSVIVFLACMLVLTGQAFSQDTEGEYIGWNQGLKYTVQEGDTLWDISEKFFDTPAMWPELWKQNPHIKNPHWIEPGTIINLYIDGGVAFVPKPEPPPPPEPEEVVEVVEEEPPPPAYNYPSIEKAGYVQKPETESLGNIVEIEKNKFMASTGDIVYVSLAMDQPYAEGDRFTVWRPLKTIKDSYSSRFRKPEIGVQHWIVGEIVCTRISNDNMRAVIERAYRAIKVGDRLMPYRNLSSDIVIKPGVPGMEGNIIAEENEAELFGTGDVVFVNKGSADGISEGQVYSVFFDKEFKSKVHDDDSEFFEETGKFIVLIAKEKTSTVLITESNNNIMGGAIFRTQELIER